MALRANVIWSESFKRSVIELELLAGIFANEFSSCPIQFANFASMNCTEIKALLLIPLSKKDSNFNTFMECCYFYDDREKRVICIH